MAEEPLNITDPNVRIATPETDEQLRKLEQEKMRAAELREQELLNKVGITDIFIYAAIKIKSLFTTRRVKTK